MQSLDSLHRRSSKDSPEVVSVNLCNFKYKKKFLHPQICVDIGAPSSVTGKKELNRIHTFLRRRSLPIGKSNRQFRFSNTKQKSLGCVKLLLDTPPNIHPIHIPLDIVEVDILALLGLNILDSESLCACTVSNRLIKKVITSQPEDQIETVDEWSVPLTRHDGHVHVKLCFPCSVFFTRSQLQKIHSQFACPSAGCLYRLLKRAGP
eukprot:IDg17416t1